MRSGRFATLVVAAFIVALGLATIPAAAAILAENSGVAAPSGVATYSTGGYGAENFTLTSLVSSITSISHVGLNNGFQPTTIDWKILSDAGGLPAPGASSLYSGSSTTFTTTNEGPSGVSGYSLFRYEIPLSSATLGPGNYWVAFRNLGDNDGPYWAYATGGTSMDGVSAQSGDNAGTIWSAPYTTGNGGNVAFRVNGEVPEPASLALLSLGGVCALRRWRRR